MEPEIVSEPFYARYWAAEAPPDHDPYTGRRVERFVALAPRRGRVLDAGCGAGAAAALLRRAGFEVIGLDVSERAAERARAGCPGMVVEVASFDDRLPFPDRSFSSIYCGDVVEHVYDVQTMANELARVLEPGGLLFMSTPYHGLAKNLVVALVDFDGHFDPEGPHVRFFSERTLRRLLERAGFVVEGFDHFGRSWPLWANMAAIARKPS